jgi:hypothetical protein
MNLLSQIGAAILPRGHCPTCGQYSGSPFDSEHASCRALRLQHESCLAASVAEVEGHFSNPTFAPLESVSEISEIMLRHTLPASDFQRLYAKAWAAAARFVCDSYALMDADETRLASLQGALGLADDDLDQDASYELEKLRILRAFDEGVLPPEPSCPIKIKKGEHATEFGKAVAGEFRFRSVVGSDIG